MTEKHVAAIEVSIDPYSLHAVDVALREVGLFVRSVADGSLRCADSKTEVVVKRGEIEWLVGYLDQHKADAVQKLGTTVLYDLSGRASRWLSTPEQPATEKP